MLLPKLSLLKIYLALAVIESAIVLAVLALIPSDPKNALFLGYSASRLALIGFVIVAAVVFGIMLGNVFASTQKSLGLVEGFLSGGISRNAVTFLSTALLAACATVLLMPLQRWGDAIYQIQRLTSLLVWGLLLALQTLILQYVWTGGKPDWQKLSPWKGTLRITAIAGGLLLALAVLISWSGIEPDRSGWLAPGSLRRYFWRGW